MKLVTIRATPCHSIQANREMSATSFPTYQAVERAVTAHDSAAWGSHIDDKFFAVTSNSDRPLDKATRMAGLDNQKVAGIAPFPLVSARMFEFGDTMIMTSRQQPLRGLPLHVTRVWFKRNRRPGSKSYSYSDNDSGRRFKFPVFVECKENYLQVHCQNYS